jgi:FtsP/CotA-like multicopper oxidase with cupredoxin domain
LSAARIHRGTGRTRRDRTSVKLLLQRFRDPFEPSLHLSLVMANPLQCHSIVTLLLLASGAAYSQAAGDPCSRPHAGSVVMQPPELRSAHGVLRVEFSFRTATDSYGRRLYCYIAADGSQAPTLRVHPGDEVVLRLRNEVPVDASAQTMHDMEIHGPCGGGMMSSSTTNLHFHGLSIPPKCHQDDVLSTLIQPSAIGSGAGFEYRFKIPPAQPPGMYWYHPHPHGFSEAQVLGGASGALIVEGMERVNPEVAGLPERVIILRDQLIPGMTEEATEGAGEEPAKDISINFVAVMHPMNKPAAMAAKPNQREFWRILNASADTYFDLQIRTGTTPREIRDPLPLDLVGMDGAPSGGEPVTANTHILLAPGARAELICTTPAEGVFAQLVMLHYDTGPDGEFTPARVIANLFSSSQAPEAASRMPDAGIAQPYRFPRLLNATPVRTRKLYFSEKRRDPNDAGSPLTYFITVDGKTPRAFDMNFTQPDITVQQGTVEDWVIENRAVEAHAFHIHQIRFQLLQRDGRTVNEPSLRDTIDLPYWDGKSTQYPSVKLRMDFRDPNIAGTFLYHCHILEHEDGGMMGSICVKPGPLKK